MKFLELKLPPVLIFAAFGVLMWLAGRVTPDAGIDGKIRLVLAIALLVIGGCLAMAGVFGLKKANTTFNPASPDQASVLVCTGIYRYTRNPMYTGLLFGLFAWACYLDNPLSLLLVFAFSLYMTRFQIKPEERILKSIFGKEYALYKNRVRRWL